MGIKSVTTHEYGSTPTGPNGVGRIGVGTLGWDYSKGNGINDAGQVVGWSYISWGGPGHAFITGPNGAGITDLGTLGGEYSEAKGINNAGQVVGNASTSSGAPHAFITGPNGVGMIDLGALGGSSSGATGINNAGQAVGYATISSGATHAFITGPNGVGATDLGPIARGSTLDINDAGQVVGSFETTTGEHAFITGSNGVGMTDLNSLVELPDGTILVEARGINNHGQVIAIGVIPEPASYALMLAGLALLRYLTRERQKI